MSKELPKELTIATDFINKAKFGEALEIIEKFEKQDSIAAEDRLSASLIKQRIYGFTRQYGKCVKIADYAYQVSQNLGLVPESITALNGKACIAFLGDYDKAEVHVREAERRLKNLNEEPSLDVLRINLLMIKSWILFFKFNLKGAAELAQECLKLTEEKKIGSTLDRANVYYLLGWINSFQDTKKALNYALKGLELNKELMHNVATAADYTLIGHIYLREGEYDLALENCKQSLSIKEIDYVTKFTALLTSSDIYYMKGRMNRVIKYLEEAVKIAEELKNPFQLIRSLIALAYVNNIIGKTDLAIELSERSINISEKWGLIFFMAQSLSQLIAIYAVGNSRVKAERYFSRISELYNQTKNTKNVDISFQYLTSKAFLLTTSTRMRDRVEAQITIKELINHPIIDEEGLMICLGLLTHILLEELSMYNDPEILDELNPLISEMLQRADTVHNYHWLAEIKFLQGKLALIRMNIKEARKLMIESQRIAELHGLNQLASKISIEHDKILEQEELWNKIKEENAPMAERLKLASTQNLIEHLQGRRVLEPPKLDHEIPVMILIITEGGIPAFSHVFSGVFEFEDDMISNFLSAINSFGEEIFSQGFDRVKFGEFKVIMDSVGQFFACYLFKGQSYAAKQKLIQFTHQVQNLPSIWRTFEDFRKTRQNIKLTDNPSLQSLIEKIFIR